MVLQDMTHSLGLRFKCSMIYMIEFRSVLLCLYWSYRKYNQYDEAIERENRKAKVGNGTSDSITADLSDMTFCITLE